MPPRWRRRGGCVVIADDHPVYRNRLALFLRERGVDVVGEIGNGRAAIELSHPPRCQRTRLQGPTTGGAVLGAAGDGLRQPLLAPGTAQVPLRRIHGEADPERSLADAAMARRELDLLACLAQSYTISRIAIALSATPGEIEQDIEVMLTKLRVERRIRDARPGESENGCRQP